MSGSETCARGQAINTAVTVPLVVRIASLLPTPTEIVYERTTDGMQLLAHLVPPALFPNPWPDSGARRIT